MVSDEDDFIPIEVKKKLSNVPSDINMVKCNNIYFDILYNNKKIDLQFKLKFT